MKEGKQMKHRYLTPELWVRPASAEDLLTQSYGFGDEISFDELSPEEAE